MKRLSDGFAFSASDLNDHLLCPHLSTLERLVAEGRLERPDEDDAARELLKEKGLAYERAYLARLEAEGRHVVKLKNGFGDPVATEAATLAAMRAGAEVIYQAGFEHGAWRGIADFLFRVDEPSALGDWSYEVADTKLAREPKPYFMLQLCFYSEHVARLQGRPPRRMHLVLGDGTTSTHRVEDYAAYFRRVRDRFLAWTAEEAPASRPVPTAHCAICPWSARCQAEWEAADHLSLVADIRRSQIAKLEEAGISTLQALAEAQPAARPSRMAATTFDTLRSQAALQLHHRQTGELKYELLPASPQRGLHRLPQPDEPAFDMEGDPHVEGGLEYLFGVTYNEGGEWRFQTFWAHDRAEEARAFAAFVDFVVERRARHPGLHVYHYAAYEESALKRLAMRHGTREEEVDQLLREEVLVDLYRVVRQGLRAGTPGYSIKQLEAFYMGARGAEVKSGGDSITAYETWISGGDPQILADIAQYNQEDCDSTRLLRDWLLARRDELAARDGEFPWWECVPHETSDRAEETRAELATLAAGLMAGLPEDPAGDAPEQRVRRTMTDLLAYHRREKKSTWWAHFAYLAMTPEELVDDADAIGGLERDASVEPRLEKRSTVLRFRYPPQHHKLRVGQNVKDAATGRGAGEMVAIDDMAGWLDLKRGPALAAVPLPSGVFPHDIVSTRDQQDALRRLGEALAEAGADGPTRHRACWELLRGAPPRLKGAPRRKSLASEPPSVGEAAALAGELDESYLVVQGPPGSGKTHLGARVIVALMKAGHRVGVTAPSHKAIHNLLSEVEAAAEADGHSFRGVKKAGSGDETHFESVHGMIENATDHDFDREGFDLVAGTSWLFARPDMEGALDYLVLDEAGQISLADALAMGLSARNLILLGDPQQLPAVTQGVHPRNSGRSVLEHVLDGDATIRPERGLFLGRTWRMHPSIAAFVSGLSYEDRLQAAPECAQQRVSGTGFEPGGLAFVPIAHDGNTTDSREEAEAVATLVDQLCGGTFVARGAAEAAMDPSQILVVSPYNRQVQRLRDALPPGARVGTVDKFQGQEAPVVIFSMATSDGEEAPRGLDFLFNRNRLNVAISRAKCLAIVVASPALLDVRCSTTEQMRLANAICAFVEQAKERSAASLETSRPC
jgi:uncharacterized protein